ncbi:MAG: hypothetical protein JW807_09630 [Spirochaetes bacterium]|nr:hypothetical protein [Spirochaetota bacterium]
MSRKNFVTWATLVVLMLFAGCESDDTKENVEKLLLGMSSDGDESLEAKYMLPGVEAIGYGYDVIYGKYASMESRRAQVLQFDAMKQQVVWWDETPVTFLMPEVIDYTLIADTSSTICAINSLETFRRDMAVSAHLEGSYGGFKGSIDAAFSESVQEGASQWFISYNDLIRKYGLRLSFNSIDEIKALRTGEFISDMVVMTPLDLFEKYGTHLLLDGIVGGRINYTSTISETYSITDVRVGAAVKASYSSAGGSVLGSGSYDSAEAEADAEHLENRQLFAVGGMSEYAIYLNSGLFTKENYADWINTVKYHPVFIDYFGENSLLPIWELCDDELKKTELEAAFALYATGSIDPEQNLRVEINVAEIYNYDSASGLQLYWDMWAKRLGSTEAYKRIAYLGRNCWHTPPESTSVVAPYIRESGCYTTLYASTGENDTSPPGTTMGGALFVIPKISGSGIELKVKTVDEDSDGNDDCLACDSILQLKYRNNELTCYYSNGEEKTVLNTSDLAPYTWHIPVGGGAKQCHFLTYRGGEGTEIVIFSITATVVP